MKEQNIQNGLNRHSPKIGIITIQKCDNFGADLQAYALGAKLRSFGYDAENIDYLFYKHPRHSEGVGEKPIFGLTLVNRAKECLFPILAGVKNLGKRHVMAVRHTKFAKWTDAYLKCGPEYRSVAALYANPPRYDVYMVGSDQVWNPRMASNILPYFLDFAPLDARKVSYAASFGVSELSAAVFLKYRALLKGFSHIGLREMRGADLVKRMRLDAEVKSTIDPTLLLTADDWAKVSEKGDVPKGKFLLLYDLIDSSETVLLARRIAAKKRLGIVRVGEGAYGPGEFIWLFAHADCVVTNSFHGTAFALIHSKDFVSVIPRGMTNAGRIESILRVVGLESQLVSAEASVKQDSIPTIDWEAVQDRLDAARTESEGFLRRAVSGEKHLSLRKTVGNLPLACYAVWNSDAVIRADSTSGGLFTWLAEPTIHRNGVVYGAAFGADFRYVHHIPAKTKEELAPLRKSKYVYSDAAAAIGEAVGYLKAGREVLFSGCPCQCAAMKVAARGYSGNLITVDFVCHGAPRPEIFAAYVDELEKQHGGRLTRYEFRNKDGGWNFQRVYYEFDNGKKCRVIPWLDPYFHGFSVNAFLRQPCYQCPFATLERVGDVTIADCWRVAASYPQWDDNRGTSLVLANSEKGLRLIRTLGIDSLPGGVYPLELAEMRNAALMQPARRSGFELRFDETFTATRSFRNAASCYMTFPRCLKYWLIYWIKCLGWSYFKHHQ